MFAAAVPNPVMACCRVGCQVPALAVMRWCLQYFAVDLGGSNLRVVSLELDGHGSVNNVVEHKAIVPDEVRLVTPCMPAPFARVVQFFRPRC